MIDDREINISPRDETKSSIRICYFRISRYLTYVSVEEQKFSKVWISKKGFSIRGESTFNQKFLVNPRFRCKRILSLITDWNGASSKLSSWNLMSITAKPSDIEVLDTSLEIWLSYFLKVFVQSPFNNPRLFQKWTKLSLSSNSIPSKKKTPFRYVITPTLGSILKRNTYITQQQERTPTWFQASTFRKCFPHDARALS